MNNTSNKQVSATSAPQKSLSLWQRLALFILRNLKKVMVVVAVVLCLFVAALMYHYLYVVPMEEKAVNQMYKAQQYFGVDSLYQKAIEGDGSFPGFQEISEKYGQTASANLSKVYLGSLYLNQSQFDQAIASLEDYQTTGSPIIDAMVLGMLGDAYSEKKKYQKAASYYQKAANNNKNSYTTPLFLQKSALVLEELKKYDDALENYETIKEDYFDSPEAKEAEKRIAYLEAKLEESPE